MNWGADPTDVADLPGHDHVFGTGHSPRPHKSIHGSNCSPPKVHSDLSRSTNAGGFHFTNQPAEIPLLLQKRIFYLSKRLPRRLFSVKPPITTQLLFEKDLLAPRIVRLVNRVVRGPKPCNRTEKRTPKKMGGPYCPPWGAPQDVESFVTEFVPLCDRCAAGP